MAKGMAVISVCLLGRLVLFAGEWIDSDVNWKVRREATENSQVMLLIHNLTDLYGPRLTGSPNFKAACDWAIRQMQRWGMQNCHLETWDFGHPGWACERYSVRVVSPYTDQLTAEVVAWTPSTHGTVKAQVVQITPPREASQQQLTAYLSSVKDKIRARIVMVGSHRTVPITYYPPAKRREESEVRARYDPEKQPPRQDHAQAKPEEGPPLLLARQVEAQIDSFLLSEGALVKITDAARAHGQVPASGNPNYEPSRAVPSIVVRSEDYGRISRTLADFLTVEMELEIVNVIYPEGRTSYNAIAEIPGTDKKDEVVMIGAHLDSWHAATGASDNAAGVAAVMEAARILQELGIEPRRTIRVALWGGEEQGLLGSLAYVSEHFGSFESPKQEFSKLVAYVNIDSGTGRVRGASIFGPSKAASVLRDILAPFEDLGVMGATSSISRNREGTDSASFSHAGLAGINFSQDPIEYRTHTWHTNLDTYERMLEPDLKQCVMVIASTTYHLAMREESLPRFTEETMPEPVH